MNTFSPKNDPSSMKLLWIEPEALRLCLNKVDVKLEDIIVLEEFGESLYQYNPFLMHSHHW